MPIKLDERLAACAALVRREARVADIGSDHAILPCFLLQNGWTNITASDINPKPLEHARKTLEKYGFGADTVRLVLSDGFEKIPPCDDVIIAGMGGETISEILTGCRYKDENTRLILQPMTRHEELRRGLYRQGFEIISETFAYCSRKPYTVIYARFTGERREIDEAFAFIGKQDNPLYINLQIMKIKKLSKGNPRFNALAEEITKEVKKLDSK
ncbi:MAG: class I SAM-dependent methyltransferase [Oscillospiraceae bacterium]|nr:class I SAM-dependent methyltransferase [Oscillospiraceae bacterium]